MGIQVSVVRKIFLFALLISVFALTSPAHAASKTIIIVVGQSNATGAYPYLQELAVNNIVVNCAVGGTSITQWQRGEPYYEQCVRIIKRYMERGRMVEWIFFMQGEKDTLDRDTAYAWLELFYSFENSFREDLGIDAPLIVAQIGSLPILNNHPYWAVVKNQQANIPNVFSTTDIKPYCPPEGVHFCDAGHAEIAERAIETFGVLGE